MTETRVALTSRCAVVLTEWESFPASVSLEYTERSPDPWYSDTETSEPICQDDAAQIIRVLLKAFPGMPIPTRTEEG
ncbi:hypothetical protein MASR1M101_41350 [Gemmatimonas sp.]